MTREEAVKLLKEYALRVKPFYEPQRTEYTQAINMAIEALTYQNLSKPNNTCEVDLISREDAMGAVQDHFNADGFKGYYDGQKMMDRITALPSAEAEWIPCSERLPEERDWYLGIFEEPDTGWINPLPFICDYLLGTKTKVTTKEGWILRGFTDREEYIDYYFNLECVAWMPLPKPYREDGEA